MKFHEFTETTGRTIFLNPEQISELQADIAQNDVTVITMASGSKIRVRLTPSKALDKIGADV